MATPLQTDALIVQACLAGDQSSIRILIERYQGDVFGLCIRMLRQSQDAEDATQDVFIRVFRSLKRWDEARPFRPWVLGIAVNRCRTILARRPKRPMLVEDLSETPARLEPRDDALEVAQAVRAAVDELRPDYRAVFVLYHEQGQSYEEIAEVVERPVGTVKTWLHRARAMVYDNLKRLKLIDVDKPDGVLSP